MSSVDKQVILEECFKRFCAHIRSIGVDRFLASMKSTEDEKAWPSKGLTNGPHEILVRGFGEYVRRFLEAPPENSEQYRKRVHLISQMAGCHPLMKSAAINQMSWHILSRDKIVSSFLPETMINLKNEIDGNKPFLNKNNFINSQDCKHFEIMWASIASNLTSDDLQRVQPSSALVFLIQEMREVSPPSLLYAARRREGYNTNRRTYS